MQRGSVFFILSIGHKRQRVHIVAAIAELEVQVGAERIAGGAAVSSLLPPVALLPYCDGRLGEVSLKGDKAVPVVYHDIVAVAASAAAASVFGNIVRAGF